MFSGASNGPWGGLSIVEATLRFDTLKDKSQEPPRVPEMRPDAGQKQKVLNGFVWF